LVQIPLALLLGIEKEKVENKSFLYSHPLSNKLPPT